MNILHISSSHKNAEAHAFSYHFKETCKRLGHNIESHSPLRGSLIMGNILEDESFKDFYIGKERYPLSRLLQVYMPEADFIFIENPKFPFDNDTKIPVFYYHRDLKSTIYVRNPTHLGIRFWSVEMTPDGRPKGGQPEIIEAYYPDIWWNKDIKKVKFLHAISKDEFGEMNKFKDIYRNRKGWAYLGSYKSVDEMMTFNTYHYEVYHRHKEIIDFIEEHNLAAKFTRKNYELDAYKQHLYKFDATLIIPAFDSWETRRLYEASYCECVPVLYIQNDNARKVFKDQGYINGETCITFNNKEDLLDLNIYDHDLEKIRKKGKKMVLSHHTYDRRVYELFSILFPKEWQDFCDTDFMED